MRENFSERDGNRFPGTFDAKRKSFEQKLSTNINNKLTSLRRLPARRLARTFVNTSFLLRKKIEEKLYVPLLDSYSPLFPRSSIIGRLEGLRVASKQKFHEHLKLHTCCG